MNYLHNKINCLRFALHFILVHVQQILYLIFTIKYILNMNTDDDGVCRIIILLFVQIKNVQIVSEAFCKLVQKLNHYY